jgi:hypothetical protein
MKMNLFENNGVHVLLQFVEWKSESMTMTVVMFSLLCAMSYLVFPSAPQKRHQFFSAVIRHFVIK